MKCAPKFVLTPQMTAVFVFTIFITVAKAPKFLKVTMWVELMESEPRDIEFPNNSISGS